MFVFGHLGIGSKMVSPWTTGLKRSHVLIGTILPDLIDKPLYYFPSWITGKSGAELGLISGPRTFGHTGLLLLLMATTAIIRRSKLLAALALGMATHIFLDNLADHFLPPGKSPSALLAMTWPISGPGFPASYGGVDGFLHSFTPFLIGAEVIGIGLLAWDQWKIAYEGEILEATQERRRFFKRIKKSRKSSR
jgi:hypothetical protein